MSSRSKLLTLLIVLIYATIMILTNARFTILDDESTIIADCGTSHPLYCFALFLRTRSARAPTLI